MITVMVNGSQVALDGPTGLVDYLAARGLGERRVAVAVNGEIVRRADYELVTIQQGDRLEIVRPAGGG